MIDERISFISTWDEPLVAVAAAHAAAGELAAALPAQRARAIASELGSAEERHVLAGFYRLAAGGTVYTAVDVDARTLADEVDAALADGRLLLVSTDGGAATAGAAAAPISDFRETPHDKLARQAMAGRIEIPFEGRRYRIMPFSRFRTATQSNFRVVPFEEARGVIERMGVRRASTPQERTLWMDVSENLSTNGRPGGLVLMHDRPTGEWERRPANEPPMTPSQLRTKIAPTDWIEVDIKYDDGTPYDGTCSIVLPGGRTVEGAPDENGSLRFDGIDPGSCTVSFPDLDQSAIEPS